MASDSNRVLRSLKRLLREERAALLSGDLSRIGDMTEEKETLLKKIPASGISAAALSQVSIDISRNQALLLAAQSGLKSAEQTIGKLNDATTKSVVYDRSGAVSNLRSDKPSLSQKL